MAEETSSPDDQALNLPDKTRSDAAHPITELAGNYFRTLIENGSDVISIHDANGHMLYQSPSIEGILGYEPEELIGRTVFDYLHPDEVERVRGLYAKLINRPNKSISAKVSFRHKDGRWRLFTVTGKNLLDNPAIKGIAFTARDITEVSLAEAALRQSEAQYRAMIEDQTELICRSLADGTLTFVNNAYCRYFNRSRNELLGRSFFQVLPDDDRQLAVNHLALITPEEPVRSMEHRVVMPDGTIRWQHWTDHGFFNEHGQLVEFQSVGRDVTERKLAEEKLAQSLSMLQATLESTTDGILVVDRQGRITSYNHKFIEMWRIPEQVMANRDDQEALAFVMNQLKYPAETMAKVHSLYDQPLAESSDIIEFKDGRIFERYSKPQIIGHKSVGRVWSFRDITGRRGLEEQLRQSQKMEAIGQLAGGIAHDFNNLLTAITGYCELSLKRLTEDDPVRRNILEIQKAGGRAASLTRQLLAFSRKQILQPKILDLNQLVSEMEKMFLRLIGENIELRTKLDERLKSVRADAGQLEQVILNLVVNARDAIPGHGKLLIETANISLAETQTHMLFTIPEGEYVMLAVSDTGQGIDSHTQGKIFEPFFSTKEQGKGTGLGLSTVYGIVKQSNGYIWVESEVGQGTTFKIYLPSVAEQQQTVAPKKHSSPFGGSETLLLVEDEEIVRRMTREILEANGYTVIEASQGVEAIEICQTHQGPIHLLLTDVIMPQMSGRELAQNITRLRPEIKVLYMSGYTAQDFTEGHGEPESGFWLLEKPFTPDRLLQRIRQVLSDHTATP